MVPFSAAEETSYRTFREATRSSFGSVEALQLGINAGIIAECRQAKTVASGGMGEKNMMKVIGRTEWEYLPLKVPRDEGRRWELAVWRAETGAAPVSACERKGVDAMREAWDLGFDERLAESVGRDAWLLAKKRHGCWYKGDCV